MIKIRLMRIGGRQRPFYRVAAINERSKRTGGYLELLGTYDPLTTPHDIKLKQDRIDYWIKQGAQPSDGYLRMIGKAPQRPPRKPKKPARNASQSDAGGEKASPAPAAAPTEEVKTEEAVEEPKTEEPVATEAPAQSTQEQSESEEKSESETEPTTNPEPTAKDSEEKK